MANDRIKVPGYARKVTYLGDIEYRNFSPDLVGFQIADDGGTPLFTLGNFTITTNFEPKKNKVFTTKKFSNFVTLSDLDLSLESAYSLLRNNAGVILNLDKKRLTNYSLFSSFREYVRVALEDIILKWPAALYVNSVYAIPPAFITQFGNTFEDYNYDVLTQEATFRINVNLISNQYQINILSGGTLGGTFNESNELRNLALKYQSYAVLIDDLEYDILEFTGCTSTTNDYIYFKVKGNPFSGNSSGTNSFYIKPNKTEENLFFNDLPDFEFYLLNRQVLPKYTAIFNFTIKTDAGDVVYTKDSVTWPTTDGYNLDYDTDAYVDYATKLLEISDNFDSSTSNLMIRFLVTDSITDFDTTALHLDPLDQDDTGQKVNKTLVIYGREFDDLNQYITGIKFANTVTYNKQDNTPDIYLKNIAKVMGWELISSVLEENLLKSYIYPSTSTYQGQAVGLTAVEADIELWRRIILNTPWIWKSKGTRKSIEFLFKFIGTPLGLIQFNEYIYLAEKKINYDNFILQLRRNNLSTNNVLITYPLDRDGYPNPLPNTSNLYFQGLGLWYRETGGDNANLDVNSGNNPHVGPYDGGYTYINQFRSLIPNYIPVSITSETTTTNTNNIFSNYNSGTITGYSGQTYVDITTTNGVDFSNCYVVNSSIILDPLGRQDETNCGCDIPENLKSLSVCIQKKPITYGVCDSDIQSTQFTTSGNLYYEFNYYMFNVDGSQYTVNGSPQYYQSIFVDPNCCKGKLVESVPYNETDSNGTLINSGFICCEKTGAIALYGNCGCFVTCKWKVNPNILKLEYPTGSNNYYLVFVDELGQNRIASYNGCNCMANGYTIPVSVTDPYTNQIGMACKLTQQGLDDLSQSNSSIISTYTNRASGTIKCNELTINPPLPLAPKLFAVVLNGTNQVNKRVSNLMFEALNTTPLFGGNYNNSNTALSANTNGIGYFYGYTPSNYVTTPYGATIEMQIYTGTTIGVTTPVDIAFNPDLGHKMYYLISNTEYDSTTFASQINNLTQLVTNLRPANPSRQTPAIYNSRYVLSFIGNPVYVYMVLDFRQKVEQPPIETFCYTITNNSKESNAVKFWWSPDGNIKVPETIDANQTMNVCAVRGSIQTSGTLQVDGGTSPCSSADDCKTIVNGPLFTINNETSQSRINEIQSAGVLLPFATFSLYPVESNQTRTGFRSVDIRDRIVVNLDVIDYAVKLDLKIGSTVVETVVIESGMGSTIWDGVIIEQNINTSNFNYNITFNYFNISTNDEVEIRAYKLI